jgi:signal peptidase I
MDYVNLPEQLNVNEKLMKKSKFRLISFFFIIAIDLYLLILHQSKPLFFFKIRPTTESISSYGSYQMILWILMVFVILFFISYFLLLNAYFKNDQMPKNKYQKIYNFFDVFTVVPVFFLLVMIVNGWFFTTAVVYQDSMNNTYFENDFVFINYRESIDEDDVIIFEKDKLYIKRIIGMPGDELIVNQSGVYLNGTMISDVPIHQGYDVFIFDGVIPENQYFVMGDNREVSVDSRYASLGFVDADEIIGGVMFEHEKSVIE